MPFPRVRRAALAAAGAAFFSGWALGERGELGYVQYVFLVTIPLATAVLAWWSGSRAAMLVTGVAALFGLLAGQASWHRAFADCLRRGEVVRAALNDFRKTRGHYPIHLRDLSVEDEPCRCTMRGTILHYSKNEYGYRIWFTDHVTRYEATNGAGFGRR
ncbi:MAG TPA: hypothetical protein VGF69_20315 [Thermoanaerobaculia bacterium]|jgi:hypothetical protein